MKRLFLICAFAFACSACDPWVTFSTQWRVCNATEERLSIGYKDGFRDGTSARTIAPGQSVVIDDNLPVRTEWGTSGYSDLWLGGGEFYITDAQGNELRRWFHSEEASSGRQFYRSTYWDYQMYRRSVANEGEIYVFVWTFTILPEDIAPADETEDVNE